MHDLLIVPKFMFTLYGSLPLSEYLDIKWSKIREAKLQVGGIKIHWNETLKKKHTSISRDLHAHHIPS